MRKKLLIPVMLIGLMAIGTTYGAFLTYKAYVEIYGYKYPLGQVEIETWQVPDIEGLEAREDYIGEMRVYTYSDDAQLVLQLLQVSHIVTNFRSFTVKVCLPLDLVFVVDLTGSMGPYMETAKAKMIELIDVIDSMHKCDFEVGVVGFYDEEMPITCPLTNDLPTVRTFIAGLTASGGGPIPQSHHVGFETALEMFQNKAESWVHDRMVVFVSDAPPGVDNVSEFASGGPTQSSLMALEEAGIKVHAVLCGPDEWPENVIYRWYAAYTGGHFVLGPERMVPVVTSNPTWIVKLTTVTPYDSYQLPLRSSQPTMKEGYYRFEIYVDFFAKAIPWHEWFTVELAAHLEKAEPKPETPPPEIPEETGLWIGIGVDPNIVPVGTTTDVTYEITPGSTTPLHVELYVMDPDGIKYPLYSDTDLGPATHPFTVPTTGPLDGGWYAEVLYTYEYSGYILTADASADFIVTA